jgi:hypothetical protein
MVALGLGTWAAKTSKISSCEILQIHLFIDAYTQFFLIQNKIMSLGQWVIVNLKYIIVR